MDRHCLKNKSKPNLSIGKASEDFLCTLPHQHFYELPSARLPFNNPKDQGNTMQTNIQPDVSWTDGKETLHSFGSLNMKSKNSLAELKKSLERCLKQAAMENWELENIRVTDGDTGVDVHAGSQTERLSEKKLSRFGLNYSNDKHKQQLYGHFHKTVNLAKQKQQIQPVERGKTAKTNNCKLIIRRTVREICQCSAKLKHHSHLINYQQFIMFLQQLQHYPLYRHLISSNTQNIVKCIWDRLNVNQYSTIRRLLCLCCEVYHSFDEKLVAEVARGAVELFSQQNQANWPPYERLRDTLSVKLDRLYANRLNFDQIKGKKMSEDVKENQFTFRPEISDKTRKLATKNKNGLGEDRTGREVCSGSLSTQRSKNQVTDQDILQRKILNEQRIKDFSFKPQLSRPTVSSWKPKAGNVEKEIVRILNARCHKSSKKQLKRDGTKAEDVVKMDIYIDKEQKHELVFDETVEVEEVIRRFSNKFDISVEAKTRLSQMIIGELRTSLLP